MSANGEAPEFSPHDVLEHFGSEDFLRDPYPFLKWMRENDPVHRTTKGFHLVSRHADLRYLFAGANDLLRCPAVDAPSGPQVAGHRSREMLRTSILSMNPPEHSRIRRLVAKAFSRPAMDNYAKRFGDIVDQLLDPLVEPLHDGEVVDLYPTLCHRLPMLSIADMLGIPAADREWLTETVTEFFAGATADARIDDVEMLARTDGLATEMEDYFRVLIDERRRAPEDDLLSELTRIRQEEPDRLGDDELLNLAWVLWLAGSHSTAASLMHCVWTMTEHPDQRHWLTGDYASALAFVEEVLRRTPVVMFTVIPRMATRVVELNGVTYPEGTDFRHSLGAANRDPEAFPDPDRFDPSRDNRRNLTFGTGIHHCLGNFHARTALAMATSRLQTRLPDLVAVNEPQWGGLLRDPASFALPVKLEGTR